jgi:hypothetical protein
MFRLKKKKKMLWLQYVRKKIQKLLKAINNNSVPLEARRQSCWIFYQALEQGHDLDTGDRGSSKLLLRNQSFTK